MASAAALAALALLVGCSRGAAGAEKRPASSTPAPAPLATTPRQPSTSPSTGSTPKSAPPSLTEDTPSVAGTPRQPLTGLPQGTPEPLVRSGAPAPTERASAAPGTFQSGARYSDGVVVGVSSVANSVATETGPGSVTGQAVTRLTLRVSNGSGVPLDLNTVVVTTAYGATQTHAQPVYDQQVQDFAGSVAPQQSVTATYAFAVPTDQRRGLHVYVDLDARHAPALLTGDA